MLIWGDNFVKNHLDFIIDDFSQAYYKWYYKFEMNEQVHMNLQTIKQNVKKWVEEYYFSVFLF
jgi:hypothetical protein